MPDRIHITSGHAALSDIAKPHHRYVDCLRGYAVLMVIACHLAYQFPELPYRAKQLFTSGWSGVQLFFMASCLTLLMSWHAERNRAGEVDLQAFFLRRFFRIAPAYYAAGVLYFFLFPPATGFDAAQAARTMAFVNAWHPAWLTAPGSWIIVPGGWSISVEFTFYAVFPFFAALVTSLRGALIALGLSLLAGALINLAALGAFASFYPPDAVSNFLFFSFPNQISVFALGAVIYFVIKDAPRLMGLVERHNGLLAAGAILAFCGTAFLPLGKYLGGSPLVPAGQAASLCLAVLVVALSRHRGVLVNRPMAAIGQVSFSAYLLHFAVLELFPLLPDLLHTQATGAAAIVAYAVGFALTVLLTYLASVASYHAMEQPGMQAGKWLIRQFRRPQLARACGSTTAGSEA
jgi:peptidoglycan/LPS O-acetylase OafA/YrhL